MSQGLIQDKIRQQVNGEVEMEKRPLRSLGGRGKNY